MEEIVLVSIFNVVCIMMEKYKGLWCLEEVFDLVWGSVRSVFEEGDVRFEI